DPCLGIRSDVPDHAAAGNFDDHYLHQAEMVSQVIALVFGGLLLAAEGGGALNLTPTPHMRAIEGGQVPDVAFKYGNDVVTFEPPGGWQIAGDPKRAVFHP